MATPNPRTRVAVMNTIVRTATPADKQSMISTLVTAFSSDPASRWVWRDPAVYLASFPAFATAFGGKAFVHGTAHCTAGGEAAALWLPPGVHPDDEELAHLLEQTAPAELVAEVGTVFEQMAAYHPEEPHWHLPLIGVDAHMQGRGYGSALLKHALAECDKQGTPAYLESSNLKNVPLYERHGFEVKGTIQVGSSPPIVPMVRLPKKQVV
jgi:GNAT superfamily N-acetyltransferase